VGIRGKDEKMFLGLVFGGLVVFVWGVFLLICWGGGKKNKPKNNKKNKNGRVELAH